MPTQHYSVTVAEIDRDQRMIVLALLRALTTLSTAQITRVLASGRVGDPLDLCQQLESLIATSRDHYRRLNNARINRRGRASRHPSTDPATPVALRPFARNGDYAGSFDELRSVTRSVLPAGALPSEFERYFDLDGLALDLHLDGALWTLDHDGKIHAFRCPRDPAPRPPAELLAKLSREHARDPAPSSTTSRKTRRRARRRRSSGS